MCDREKLSNNVYQFDGFGFYNSLEEPNYWQEHGHEEIQITLPQYNARAWIEYQSLTGKRLFRKIKPGEVFLVGQNTPHQLDWQQKAELTLFYLHPRFFSSVLNDPIANHHLEVKDSFSLTKDTLIQEVGAIFRHLCNLGSASEKLYIENLANLLAVHLIKNYLNYDVNIAKSCQKLSRKKTTQILEYIEANLNNEITLSDLADLAGVGKFYFCRLFKSSVNMSPYKYVLQQRVERAKKLLKSSDLPICDLALECGFSSQSHLAKHFRSMVGTTPMSYRQGHR